MGTVNGTSNPSSAWSSTGAPNTADVCGHDLAGPAGTDDLTRTRPGTPMVGPYSVNQMDDFFAAITRGEVKPTGIMNLVQRLCIAERCPAGARVVDVCCGRGLQLPMLYRYAPHLAGYVGLDISADNLAEVGDRIRALDEAHGGRPFPIELIECDVAAPWPTPSGTTDEAAQGTGVGGFDVAIYTSAMEHLPRDQAVASLRHTAAALAPGGVLYLSTPDTEGDPPRRLQHRVHVYEWTSEELLPVLAECGLQVVDRIGLLSPGHPVVAAALQERFGPGAAAWYRHLQATVPAAVLDPVTAAAIPDAAIELLYACRKPT